MEKTLVLVKPDGVQRGLIGEVIRRLENKGLKIVAMRMLQVDEALARKHYAAHVNKPFFPGLLTFITACPIVAMVLEGPSAVAVVRNMMGPTNGAEAPLGTIRGDYGISKQFNLVHGSDSPEAAETEISLYFNAEDIMNYDIAAQPWMY
ncbi:MAG TPA: nucleoside-diphosphate kinase [Phycisphaerae bacterium]|nr:nucleoside-diphosphate kinase [Phycisphaerae bacterium]